MIPENRRTNVLTKYYDEVLNRAHSLLSVDAEFLNRHHEEIGNIWFNSLLVDSIDESLDRLRTTCYQTYITLLRRPIPLTATATDLFSAALIEAVPDIVESGRASLLTLVMELAKRVPWSAITERHPQSISKLKKQCRQLLFMGDPKKGVVTKDHMNTILALWMTLSMRYRLILCISLGIRQSMSLSI